jgi:hypothetical protein
MTLASQRVLQPTAGHPSLLEPVRATVRAIASTIVPEASDLDEPGWTSLERIIERALAARPRSVQRQVVLFMRVVNVVSIMRYGRGVARLGAEQRRAVLDWLQDAPLLVLRRGLWGIRTLALMGYYARPEAARAIGYRADPRGWDARRPSMPSRPGASGAS